MQYYCLGTATRSCDFEGKWKYPNLVNCTDKVFHEASQKVFLHVYTLITYIKGIDNIQDVVKSCGLYWNGKKL